MNSKKDNINSVLFALGFSQREVAVYLAVLELGRATVTEISRKAGINRTTGYDILDTLVHKNLVRLSGKRPKEEYIAEAPEHLIQLLEEKRVETEEHILLAKELLPELTAMHTVQGRPQVRFYEGNEGLRQVYEDTLTSSESICAYAAVDDMHKALPNYFPQYYERRTQKGIAIRAIIPATDTGRARSARDTEEFRETVLVPADQFYSSPEVNIYDNKVMIASWKEKLGIIIESSEIADAMKKIFELAWIGAQSFKDTPSQSRSVNN